MPALNHVTYWDQDHWRRITAEEATELTHGHSVSVNEKFFWCSLCNHFVLFVGSNGKIAPYFRHSRGDEDKFCEDRAQRYEQSLKIVSKVQLPLKLVINNETMAFYIGFYCSQLERMSGVSYGKFTIKSESDRALSYGYDRLIGKGIEYLWVSSHPVNRYDITFEGDCPGAEHWARQIEGCLNGDIWFDSKTGKRLPKDADVTVGTEYLLLTDHMLNSNLDVAVSRICLKGRSSRFLYRIKANNYSHISATFFADLHARLTAKPVRMFAFWPLTTKRPYNVIYQDERVLFYCEGEDVRIYLTPMKESERRRGSGEKFLTEIKSNVDRMIVFAGRMTVLKHSLLNKGKLQERDLKKPQDYEAVIALPDGKPIEGEQINKRFKDDDCVITLAFDGRGEIVDHDLPIESFEIKAGTPTVKRLLWQSKLVLYVGEDRVRAFQYGPPRKLGCLEKEQDSFPKVIPLYDDRTRALTSASAKKLCRLSICDRTKIRQKVMSGTVPLKQRQYLK